MNKVTNSQIKLRIPSNLKEEVEELSIAKKVSMNAIIVELIEKALTIDIVEPNTVKSLIESVITKSVMSLSKEESLKQLSKNEQSMLNILYMVPCDKQNEFISSLKSFMASTK